MILRQMVHRLSWPVLLLVLAAGFVFVSGLSLGLVETAAFSWEFAILSGIWLGLALAGFFGLRWLCPDGDPLLFPIVILLMGWGLWLVERLAPNFTWRQMIWIGVGVAAMLGAAALPTRLSALRLYPYTWLLGGLLLLAATLIFGVNPSGGGARLWLKFPFLNVYFQPSELLKLLFLIFLAGYFSRRESLLGISPQRGRLGPLPYIAPLLLMWGFCMGLLVWQRDLGAAALFFLVFLALFYLASGEKVYVGIGLLLLLVASVFAYFAFDLVALRIDAWLNPWPEAGNRAYQIVQSLYAIGAGGMFGEGIGQGFPVYIPVVHSDFAFAAIAEEWGMIGSLVVILCFAALTYRAFRIALLARWPFDMYLAAGIGVMLGMQAFLIMGGVARLLPLTGVTLPFVSYGGSSLLVSCAMIGLLLNLSNHLEEGELRRGDS